MTNNKVTVSIPQDMTLQLVALKNELKTSMSALYKEALELYLEKKEIEKWEKGARLATQDKKYVESIKDFTDTKGDIYEY